MNGNKNKVFPISRILKPHQSDAQKKVNKLKEEKDGPNEEEMVEERYKNNKTLTKEDENKKFFFKRPLAQKVPIKLPTSSVLRSYDTNIFQKKKSQNFFKKLFFWHLNRLFNDHSEEQVTVKHLNRFADKMKIQHLETNFQKKSKNLKKENLFTSNLIIPTLKVVKYDLITAIFLRILVDCGAYFLPILAKTVINEFKSQKRITLYSFLISLVILILYLFLNLARENTLFYTKATKAASHQILRAVLFKKLKNCDFNFLEQANSGFISDMINVEIDRICNYIEIIPRIFSTPISIGISITLIYLQVGYIVWLPIMVFLILSLIKLFLKVYKNSSKNKYSAMSSKRADILNEMVPYMEQVKYNSKEQKFRNMLLSLRIEEMKHLKSIHLIESIISFIEVIYPILSAALTIAFYNQVTGSMLDVVTTYSIAAIFSASRRSFLAVTSIFDRFSFYTPAARAFRLFLDRVYEKDDVYQEEGRLETVGALFSGRKEVRRIPSIIVFDINGNGNGSQIWDDERDKIMIELKRCDFYTDFTTPKIILQEVITKEFNNIERKEENNTLVKAVTMLPDHENTLFQQGQILTKILKNINLEVKNTECVCLFGLLGSGIRTLLYALQNETVKGKGEILVNGNTSFLDSKRPCIVEGTLRDNILLGSKYEKNKYQETLKLVQLDVSKFAGEDFVEVVGEAKNFTNLEKKKILLARVIYNDIKILLAHEFFDEINDESEKTKLFTAVKDLYRNRVFIYSSNDMNLIKRSSRIIVLDEGRIVADGEYKKLIKDRNSAFYQMTTLGNLNDLEGSSIFSERRRKQRKKGKSLTNVVKTLRNPLVQNLYSKILDTKKQKKSTAIEAGNKLERLKILKDGNSITQSIFGVVVKNV